jgi:hypothetical protein
MVRMLWVMVAVLLFASSCSDRGATPQAATGTPLLAEGQPVDLFKVSEAVWAREANHGFSSLTEPEQTFLCVWSLEAEVNNGGFAQFFANSSGDYASATPGALQRVGAPEMAALVVRAMEVFGGSGPPADRESRERAMDKLPGSAAEAWSTLDDEFYKLPSPQQGLTALVESNRDAFFAP